MIVTTTDLKNKKIAVVCGGEHSERDVSLRTGDAVYKALLASGYDNVRLVDFDSKTAVDMLSDRPDICFNALHGKVGESGVLQGYLEMLNIPYTGSGVCASAVAFDKHLSKVCFEGAGVPTASYKLLSADDSGWSDILPCVIKPCREGSTVGITIARTKQEAQDGVDAALKYDSKVLVEKFIDGKELTISIMDGEAMPIIWIRPKSGFYDYHSKYTVGATEYLFETELTDFEEGLIKDTALKAHYSLGCEGVSRVDIIYDGNIPYVLEVNTAPGMTETSLLPKACAKAGISFIELVERMLVGGLGKRNT